MTHFVIANICFTFYLNLRAIFGAAFKCFALLMYQMLQVLSNRRTVCSIRIDSIEINNPEVSFKKLPIYLHNNLCLVADKLFKSIDAS